MCLGYLLNFSSNKGAGKPVQTRISHCYSHSQSMDEDEDSNQNLNMLYVQKSRTLAYIASK